MGFLGSWRNILRISKNNVTGTVDAATFSKKIIAEAEKLKLNNIARLFDNNYLKNIDNKVFLGNIELKDFIKAARLGDYEGSFKTAFGSSPLLDNPGVKQALQKILSEAATTLPDLKVLHNVNAVTKGRKIFLLTDKASSASELSRLVAKNNQLKNIVDKLVLSVNRTKKIKFLGYTILIGAAAVTAYDIYQTCAEISANGTGCFIYYTAGGEIKKCKISPYSCLHATQGTLCSLPLLTNEMISCTDCQISDNKKKECIHCNNEDPYNEMLGEHQMLRCESPDPIDVLLEGIHQTIDGIISVGGNITSSLFNKFWVILMAILLIFIVISFFR